MKRPRTRFTPAPVGSNSTTLIVATGVLAVVLLGGVLWASQRGKPPASAPRPGAVPAEKQGSAVSPPATPTTAPAQPTRPVDPPSPGQDQSPVGEKPKAEAKRPGWKLVWFDEFDKAGAPDPAKWNYESGFVRNSELQYYTRDRRENARIEDGHLIIEGRKERFRNPDYQAGEKGNWNKTKEFADYTAASITTRGKAEWTYGRVEVCAKLPTGRGTWPAIWMLGTNIGKVGWPKCGEIDIMENVGFNPDTIHATVHTGKYNHVKGTQKGGRIKVPKPHMAFHVYAMEWDAKKIDFFVDDKKVFSFADDGGGEDAWPFFHDHFLLLNLAIGGGWGGAKGVDESIWPQKYYIDYVRVYQRP